MVLNRLTQLVAIFPVLLQSACLGDGGGGTRSLETETTEDRGDYYRFAYAVNTLDDTISMYIVDADSGLVRHNGYQLTGDAPYRLAIDPSNRFVYVVNTGSNDISSFAIDTASGRLNEPEQRV